ncbi:MAG: hypothetical protein DRJ21_00785, partial [Candidatus Methanomethylicota archaeon]
MEDNSLSELPRISIIIPVRNCARTIGDLLDSLMKLDYPKEKIEIIVIDGRSTDNTAEIVLRYPVKLLFEPGYGPNYARKIGVENSNGEVLVFTDGDCVVPKHWVKAIIKNFSLPKIGCVGGSVYADESLRGNLLVDYADDSIMRIMPLAKEKIILDEPEVFKHIAFCNMAIKREVLESIGGLDEKMKTFEDVDIVQSICEAGYKMILDPQVFVWHKHRQTLKGILKQTFNYGKGGPYFRRKHPNSKITKFYRFGLTTFYMLTVFALISFYLSYALNKLLFLLLGLSPLILGYIADFAYYMFKRNGFYRSLVYPFIDFMRIIAFCLGDLISLLR